MSEGCCRMRRVERKEICEGWDVIGSGWDKQKWVHSEEMGDKN